MPPLDSPVVATLGNFDGVHRGHQQLLRRVQEVKRDWVAQGGRATAIAISFHPHPAIVLGRVKELPLISSLRERLEILSSYDIDILYMLHFTEAFAHTPAASFVNDVLFGELTVQHLVVGADAAVGYQREGDVPFLTRMLEEHGRSLEVVQPVMIDGVRIRSERIRGLLRQGRVEEAAVLLGRRFTLDSIVVPGERRGTGLGFPTANLKRNEQLTPADGVYATSTSLRGQVYQSITNVGFRPTFRGAARAVETHLIAYAGEPFYGERIQVEFAARIRDEQRFASVEALQQQIVRDIAAAKEVLDERK